MDKILISVLRGSFITACDEMGLALLRTTRSPWLNAARDFSISLFDADRRLVAQADFIPILVGTSRFALEGVFSRFGNDIHPGDAIILNDPSFGGNHLSDITLVYPIFFEDRLAYWVVNKAHFADIGGCVAGGCNTHAQEIFQEGMRLPPVKLYDRYVLNSGLKDFLLLNVREAETFWADLESLVASAKTGERKIHSLLKKYGKEALFSSHDVIFEAGEAELHTELKKIPEGTYRGRATLEMEPSTTKADVNVDVAITIRDGSIHFDYAGTHPQVASFVNSPLANTYSATCVALFSVLDADIRRNEGTAQCISVTAPEGSLLNPAATAPVALCTLTTAEVVIEACWHALSETIATRVPCGWARTATPITFGKDPRTERWYTMGHFLTHGGAGAVHAHDGWSYLAPTVCMGALTKPNVETIETDYPYRILAHEFAQDSCGAGTYRGGMGTLYRMSPIGHRAEGVLRADGMRTAPYGLQGGRPGRTTQAKIIRRDGSQVVLSGKAAFTLNQDEVFESTTSGGGGWGDPKRRSRDLIMRDLEDQLISEEHARREFAGVRD